MKKVARRENEWSATATGILQGRIESSEVANGKETTEKMTEEMVNSCMK